jgi:hypothetical protein
LRSSPVGVASASLRGSASRLFFGDNGGDDDDDGVIDAL